MSLPMKKNNDITIKIKYSCNKKDSDRILEYIKNYNNVLRFIYNRLYEAPKQKLSTKDAITIINSMNNVFVDTYFKNGALYEARALIKLNKEDKIIFGGKKLFLERDKGNISSEEFKLAKLHPLQVIGASYNEGNCKFHIQDINTIIFKPTRNEHFTLHLETIGKNYEEYIKLLICHSSKYSY